MVAMLKFRDALGRAMSRFQPLVGWYARFAGVPAVGKPAEALPGAYALLAGLDHTNDR